MSERKCKYLSDDFSEVCVNGDCPVCADFCPVTRYPEICKFAEIEQENRYKKGLKPCPFCGEAPKIVVYKGKDGFRDRFAVQCAYDEGGCGAEGGQRHSRDEAITIWNERKFILRGRAKMPKPFDPCDRCPAYYRAMCEEEGKVHSRLCLIRVLIYECWLKQEAKDG